MRLFCFKNEQLLTFRTFKVFLTEFCLLSNDRNRDFEVIILFSKRLFRSFCLSKICLNVCNNEHISSILSTIGW